MNQVITHVAIRFRGETYSLPPPYRHHDVIRLIVVTLEIAHVDVREDDQGFLIDGEQYVRRKPALRHARECGQLKLDGIGEKIGKLFSEDVW